MKATPIEQPRGWYLQLVYQRDGSSYKEVANDSTTADDFGIHTNDGAIVQFFKSREEAIEHLTEKYIVSGEQDGVFEVEHRPPVERPCHNIYDTQNKYCRVHVDCFIGTKPNEGICIVHVFEHGKPERVNILTTTPIHLKGLLVLKTRIIEDVYGTYTAITDRIVGFDPDKFCKVCEYPCGHEESAKNCQFGYQEMIENYAQEVLDFIQLAAEPPEDDFLRITPDFRNWNVIVDVPEFEPDNTLEDLS